MAEILTESFCERCGTRYTFQAAAPSKQRLGRFRTLSKGLKNYVLSDETSLEEALADARSDVDRSASSQQLEAFHQTFNFCMSCRQYTCANCWNEVEGRCLTCAPDLTHDILPQPFPQLDGLPAIGGLNGHDHGAGNGALASAADLAWPTTDLPPGHEPEAEAEAEAAPDATAVAGTEIAPDARPAVASEEEADEVSRDQPPKARPAPQAEPPRLSFLHDRTPRTVEEEAAVAAAQTSDLLARFRPGQSLDAAIAAFEAEAGITDTEESPLVTAATEELAVAELEPEVPVLAAEPEPEPDAISSAEPEPVATAEPEPVATAGPEPQPVAVAGPEPQPVAVAEPEPEPEPVAVAPPEPEPEPVAVMQPEPEPTPVAAPEPEPVAAARPGPVAPSRDDRVEAPVWRIVAPDATPDTVAPIAPPPVPTPNQPVQWPAPSPAAFLATTPRTSTEAMWAASGREVLAERPAQGVQSCVNCGLALSATARFCRRCGNRQATA